MTKDDFIAFIKEFNVKIHNLDADNITRFYLKNVELNNSDAVLAGVAEYFGDALIKCPTYLFAKRYAERSAKRNVFVYELTHRMFNNSHPEFWGVHHGCDIPFVFGIPLQPSHNTILEVDIEFSKQVIKWWTDFAKYGYFSIKCLIILKNYFI